MYFFVVLNKFGGEIEEADTFKGFILVVILLILLTMIMMPWLATTTELMP